MAHVRSVSHSGRLPWHTFFFLFFFPLKDFMALQILRMWLCRYWVCGSADTAYVTGPSGSAWAGGACTLERFCFVSGGDMLIRLMKETAEHVFFLSPSPSLPSNLRFRQCLLTANDRVSNMVGYGYFNVLQTPCFTITETMQCTRTNWFGM